MSLGVLTYIACVAILISSCGSAGTAGKDAEGPARFPAPGTVVASAEMPVEGDTLNHFRFTVKVIADSDVRSGVYDVDADFGPNFAEGQLVMPRGGGYLVPVIRKDTIPYTFIIGFKIAGDTTFYDYYRVTSSLKATKMQYIKAYSF